MTDDAPSASQVKKAGRVLRRSLRNFSEMFEHPDEYSAALDVLASYRAAHQTPLINANNSVRGYMKTLGIEGPVTQRLKRIPTVLDKLQREPTLDLSRMHDIGGCRAVLQNIADVRRLEAKIIDLRPVTKHRDYISMPRASGYRAVHVIAQFKDRNIEIQLRTGFQHDWAIIVEKMSNLVGVNLKGDGSHQLQQVMRLVSERIALVESGTDVDTERLNELREAISVIHQQMNGGSDR